MKMCCFVLLFFMAKLSALEKSRRVSEMRDRLAEYVTGNHPKIERIRAADIALRLSKPLTYSVYTVGIL
jgi:hypothetical protein